jgi:hypothetical protein
MHEYGITLRRQLFQRIRIGNTPGFADTQRFLFPATTPPAASSHPRPPAPVTTLLRDTAQANHSYT